MSHSHQQPRVFLWSHARTACHFLERMLSGQPDTAYLRHVNKMAFMQQVTLLMAPLDKASKENVDALLVTYKEGFDRLNGFLKDADSKGQKTFYHDHTHFAINPAILSQYIHGTLAQSITKTEYTLDKDLNHTNITIFPDDWFLDPRHVPVFTIRHPLAMIPSLCRAIVSLGGVPERSALLWCTSLRWNRIMFDWFISNGKKAYIIDADDYTTNTSDGTATPGPALEKLCVKVGFDPKAILTKWTPATEEEMNTLLPAERLMLQDLLASNGVMPKKLGSENKTVASERSEWVKEFGESVADLIEEMVKRCMDDYKYLHGIRIQA